jgi:predicted nucleic acid-binding Zn ribbon protein
MTKRIHMDKKTCVVCGAEFTPRNSRELTCSKECSNLRRLRSDRDAKRRRRLSKHEKKINEFIPKAVRHANKRVPDWSGSDERAAKWDQVYFQRMNELTINAGLRREVA